MENENKVDPFFNVEEGLKISPLTVNVMLENRSHIIQTKHAI